MTSLSRSEWVKVYTAPYFGGDPEFFFEKDGKIIGSEKVLKKGGLSVNLKGSLDGNTLEAFVLDGVQAELHTKPNTCRELFSDSIRQSFVALREHLKKKKGVKASFRAVVEVAPEEFESLSPECRVLGCKPSLNIYDESNTLGVDPATYTIRSAGGHIHLGINHDAHRKFNIPDVIAVMDTIVGLTCVLIDRDPMAAIRREVYGRAGEYRIPSYGLEYRTLSNFWLRSYQLTSFVMGLSRMALNIVSAQAATGSATYNPGFRAMDKLKSLANQEDVRRAINTNDLELAKKVWSGVEKFIAEHVPNSNMGLDHNKLENFKYFVEKVEEGGLEFWFPEDPMDHWCSLPDPNSKQIGWESFIMNVVPFVKTQETCGRKFFTPSASTALVHVPSAPKADISNELKA